MFCCQSAKHYNRLSDRCYYKRSGKWYIIKPRNRDILWHPNAILAKLMDETCCDFVIADDDGIWEVYR
nr:hypothetical protein [Exiguobacterium sp. s11]